MKQIIAAGVTTLLLCSASATYAQIVPLPQTPTVPTIPQEGEPDSAAAQDPRLDVKKLAPNQREYLVLAVMNAGNSFVPEQLAKFKDMYAKMQPEQQMQMAQQVTQRIPYMPEKMRNDILDKMPPPK